MCRKSSLFITWNIPHKCFGHLRLLHTPAELRQEEQLEVPREGQSICLPVSKLKRAHTLKEFDIPQRLWI